MGGLTCLIARLLARVDIAMLRNTVQAADRLTIEESTALLHEIYPGYPDLRNSRPVPADLQRWLEDYRSRARAVETSESSRTS
jgi:hypothetical protein